MKTRVFTIPTHYGDIVAKVVMNCQAKTATIEFPYGSRSVRYNDPWWILDDNRMDGPWQGRLDSMMRE